MSKSVEPDWMEAAREGDAGAFKRLYEALAPAVYRTVLAMVRDRDQAEDVVQETFLAVHLNLSRFRGESDIRTWVTRIALNRARDYLRRVRNAPRSLDALEKDDSRPLEQRLDLASAPEPQRDFGLEHQLYLALDRLPADFRLCFLLREVGELSYQEIAAALHVSVGTIRSRLSRAREQLRRRLEGVRKE